MQKKKIAQHLGGFLSLLIPANQIYYSQINTVQTFKRKNIVGEEDTYTLIL